MDRISLSDAKANLSAIIDRVERGEQIEIMRRGKPVARLAPTLVEPKSKKPFDWDELDRVVGRMTPQTESAGDFMRRVRDSGY
nr:type II toxin-antitoxin system prevent-host-death family antitoxin [uncultured Brevundimonas sp.]